MPPDMLSEIARYTDLRTAVRLTRVCRGVVMQSYDHWTSYKTGKRPVRVGGVLDMIYHLTWGVLTCSERLRRGAGANYASHWLYHGAFEVRGHNTITTAVYDRGEIQYITQTRSRSNAVAWTGSRCAYTSGGAIVIVDGDNTNITNAQTSRIVVNYEVIYTQPRGECDPYSALLWYAEYVPDDSPCAATINSALLQAGMPELPAAMAI